MLDLSELAQDRSHEELRSVLDDLELVEPGYGSIPLWRPDRPAGEGVARKPEGWRR